MEDKDGTGFLLTIAADDRRFPPANSCRWGERNFTALTGSRLQHGRDQRGQPFVPDQFGIMTAA